MQSKTDYYPKANRRNFTVNTYNKQTRRRSLYVSKHIPRSRASQSPIQIKFTIHQIIITKFSSSRLSLDGANTNPDFSANIFLINLFAARGETGRDDSPDIGPQTLGAERHGRREALHVDARCQAHRPVRRDRQETGTNVGPLHTRGQRHRQERRRLYLQDCPRVGRLQQRMPKSMHTEVIVRPGKIFYNSVGGVWDPFCGP